MRCTGETTREADAIEAVAGCHCRIVLLHDAPITDTLVGEPETIWAFPGSPRLATPIGAHRPDLVLHGHAHRGPSPASSAPSGFGNVTVAVTGRDGKDFEL